MVAAEQSRTKEDKKINKRVYTYCWCVLNEMNVIMTLC